MRTKKQFIRLVALLLTLILSIGVLPTTMNAEEGMQVAIEPMAGQQISTISNATELAAISGSNGHYVLANDITIPPRPTWIPIDGFRGTLDGAGHTITFTTRMTQHGATAGLFGGITSENVVIRNLSVRTTATGSIEARALNSQYSYAFAGGLIGIITQTSQIPRNAVF